MEKEDHMGAKKINAEERKLLKRLEESGGKDRDALADLVKVYEMSGQTDRAKGCITMLMSTTDDNEERLTYF
jgi:hypothetical protein